MRVTSGAGDQSNTRKIAESVILTLAARAMIVCGIPLMGLIGLRYANAIDDDEKRLQKIETSIPFQLMTKLDVATAQNEFARRDRKLDDLGDRVDVLGANLNAITPHPVQPLGPTPGQAIAHQRLRLP